MSTLNDPLSIKDDSLMTEDSKSFGRNHQWMKLIKEVHTPFDQEHWNIAKKILSKKFSVTIDNIYIDRLMKSKAYIQCINLK